MPSTAKQAIPVFGKTDAQKCDHRHKLKHKDCNFAWSNRWNGNAEQSKEALEHRKVLSLPFSQDPFATLWGGLWTGVVDAELDARRLAIASINLSKP